MLGTRKMQLVKHTLPLPPHALQSLEKTDKQPGHDATVWQALTAEVEFCQNTQKRQLS